MHFGKYCWICSLVRVWWVPGTRRDRKIATRFSSGKFMGKAGFLKGRYTGSHRHDPVLSMSHADFTTRYEDTLLAIEDAIEGSGADIDYETVNDILTLTCPDGSAIIITKQSATKQLWLAAKSGGFHFDITADGWVCDADGETLSGKLARIIRLQAGIDMDFQLA